MNVDTIRNVFSKGVIATYNSGVIIYYNYKERWISQTISENRKEELLGIINNCTRIGIEYKAGSYVRLIFQGNCFDDIGIYQPLEEEISLEELNAIVDSYEDTPAAIEFFSSFTEDMLDEQTIMERFSEYMSSIREDSDRIPEISDIYRWNKIYEISSALSSVLGCELEYEPPDDVGDGYCEVQFPEECKSTKWISGGLKDAFYTLVSLCSVVEIECLVTDGFLNISFYA